MTNRRTTPSGGTSGPASVMAGWLCLPPDVQVVPIAELDAGLRRRLPETSGGGFVLTRRLLRTPSRLLDADSAALLGQFTAPATVVQAVLRHSRQRGADPAAALDAAYPMLERLVREGFLIAVPAEAAPSAAAGASWQRGRGETLAGFVVVRRERLMEDTEVYLVRGTAATGAAPGRELALKIARRAGEAGAEPLLREAAMLTHLQAAPGTVVPRLAAAGIWQGRRFLAMEWWRGIDVARAAAELRAGGAAGRAELLELCCAVASAYAGLHAGGVLHGDVHPHNILVQGGGEVRLIDLGAGRWLVPPPGSSPPRRAGVAFYFEPEVAAELLAGRPAPPATAAGEQYALAALLYQLTVGSHPIDFSLEREALLRQIAEVPPRSFAEAGAEPWPAVEAVLARALAKQPAARFPDLAAFAAAWHVVADEIAEAVPADPPAEAAPRRDRLPPARCVAPNGLAATRLAAVLEDVRPGGAPWRGGRRSVPVASVYYGDAGIALTLYRAALALGEPEQLADADLWLARALRAATARGGEHPSAAGEQPPAVRERSAAAGELSPAAFYDRRLGLTVSTIGRTSLYHTAPGVHCVAALVARALDDLAGVQRAIAAFVAAARRDGQVDQEMDLVLGRAGLLSGCCLLAALREGVVDRALLQLGDEILALLRAALEGLPPVAACDAWPNLGLAHGWAGVLHASLRWCRLRGLPVPAALIGRLHELAAAGESHGRGVRWPWLAVCPAGSGTPPTPLAAATPRRTPPRPRPRPPHDLDTSAGPHDPAAPVVSSTLVPPPVLVGYSAGWCNGSAGFVYLWTLAAELIGEPVFADLGYAAAWHAWESADESPSLCCGLAGRAYALLELYQRSGDRIWLRRARLLGDRAAAAVAATAAKEPQRRTGAKPPGRVPRRVALEAASLFRGPLGVALLVAELEHPECAAMPLLGAEP